MNTSERAPKRAVIEDVPRVSFYGGGKRCPEDIILPSVVRAVLEFLGEQDYGCKHCLAQRPDCRVLCTYAFLVGVSGAAAYLSWKEGWHGDNVALSYMAADPRSPERHIFDAIGYAYEIVGKEDGRDNETLFRQRIAESIERGVPVIGYGIIGPPEPTIITGYDENGEVLIGWSFFQDFPDMAIGVEYEPSGYFRKHNWFQDTECLLVIGARRPKPSMPEVSRKALAWLLEVARVPMVRPEPNAPEAYQQRANGLAAYDAWARHILHDEAFLADDESMLKAHWQIHNDAVGAVAEARWYGSAWLAERAEDFAAGPGSPGRAEHVLQAAACYAAEHDLMWEAWEVTGGIGNAEAFRKMGDPVTRHALADVIRRAHEKYAEAANHIERALA